MRAVVAVQITKVFASCLGCPSRGGPRCAPATSLVTHKHKLVPQLSAPSQKEKDSLKYTVHFSAEMSDKCFTLFSVSTLDRNYLLLVSQGKMAVRVVGQYMAKIFACGQIKQILSNIQNIYK